ncbi:acyl-CoA thioesterase [Peterkaempfera sp. SMS 1(5)a]|uniref:acyl-CoA thioesterase n=1 Tax=Peterkaempfera podocarpi TaxID=3232308 RepID=UPI00366D0857
MTQPLLPGREPADRWPAVDLDDLLDTRAAVTEATPGRFLVRNVRSTSPRTLGAQLIGQTVALAERSFPGMAVQSLHTVFHRGGDSGQPMEAQVETVQSGRVLATAQVTYHQQGREHCRALLMLSREEPDFLRHGTTLPDGVLGPDACEEFDCGLVPWETRTEGGSAAWDQEQARPATVDIWMRCKELPYDPSASRSLLAHACEGFVVPVATRPYPQAELDWRGGRGVTVLLSQTVTFHERFSLRDWVLLRSESVYAGHGRMHGRLQAYANGRLVASVSADALMRAASPGHPVG